jgi:hypothetical protein
MSGPTIQQREYTAEVLTNHYLLTGELAPLGPLLTFLNIADRGVVVVRDVKAAALDEGNAADSFHADELIVAKDEIIAIRLAHAVTQATVQLLPRRERLLVFTPRIVVQGYFHCGPDTRVGDLFEATPGRWAPATDALVHTLLPVRVPVFETAKMLLVNKRHVRMYQPLDPETKQ